MSDDTEYSMEQFMLDMQRFISAERESSYSKEELEKLYDLAIDIRRKTKACSFGNEIPFPLWQALGNIDFGAIDRNYRNWVLDNAQKALDTLAGT